MPSKAPIPDSAFITTAEHKKWNKAGIPREFWPVLPTHNPSFRSYKIARGPVKNAIQQRHTFKFLTHEIRHNHPVIPIFSEPTDDGALLVASSVLASYLRAGYPCELHDLSFGHKSFRRRPRVVAYHNIMLECTPDRIEVARDMIIRYRDALRLVIIAGVPKFPEQWWLEKFRYRGTYFLVTKDVQ